MLPHEILKLRIKDIVFKTAAGNCQYAEVLVNGKTGSRHIPLINSIPYVKDWLDEHPQQGNPNAPLICGYNKSLGRRLKPATITRLYESYKTGLFSKIIKILDKKTILVSGIFHFKEFKLIATQNYIILPDGKRMTYNKVNSKNRHVMITAEGIRAETNSS